MIVSKVHCNCMHRGDNYMLNDTCNTTTLYAILYPLDGALYLTNSTSAYPTFL